MKQFLQQYAAYNLWANKRFVERLLLLDHEQVMRILPGSFDSIFRTTEHLWDAEMIWWQRLKLAEHITAPSTDFKGNFEELSVELLRSSVMWDEWVKNANDNALSHVFAYRNTKKEQFKQPVSDMLVHLFNHQTYHRGQLVVQLRTLGEEKIPNTDFIQFMRRK